MSEKQRGGWTKVRSDFTQTMRRCMCGNQVFVKSIKPSGTDCWKCGRRHRVLEVWEVIEPAASAGGQGGDGE